MVGTITGMIQLFRSMGEDDTNLGASIGTAGVPSAGIIMLILVLQSIGMGGQAAAGIALILGVDRILDMLRTVVNVTGDLTAASFVARTEGEELVPRPVDHPVRMRKA